MTEPIHKLAAAVVFTFLTLHLFNHLMGLLGPDMHRQALDVVRLAYRPPILEAVLGLSLLVLTATGLRLCLEIWQRHKDFVHQLQAASGLVLVIFLTVHVSHIFYGRWILQVDTDLSYVSQSQDGAMDAQLAQVLFGSGLMALFLHFGCVFFGVFKKSSRPTGYALLAITVAGGGLFTWALLGMLAGHTLSLPPWPFAAIPTL